MSFLKLLLSASGTSGVPKPRLQPNPTWAEEITKESEKRNALWKEITSGDYIIVYTKSTGNHFFGAGTYTEYEPRVLYVHSGKSYFTFPLHDVVFVHHVIANEEVKYLNQ